MEADALASSWVELRIKVRDSIPQSVSKFVAQIKSIDTTGCPTEFREAYVRYCFACEGMQQQIKAEPQSFGEGFLMGFINALGGKPDGGLGELEDGRKKRIEELRITRREVEVLAIRYDAKKTQLADQAEKLTPFVFPIVGKVNRGGQAERLGILTDDIYLQYDGVWLNEETSTNNVLYAAMANSKKQAKTTVEIRFLRANGFVSLTAPAGVMLGFSFEARR